MASAERQLKEAEARNRASIADAGEVARYLSQVQSRRSSVLLYEHEKELLWQTLTLQVDGVDAQTKSIDLMAANAAEAEAAQCLQAIQSQTTYSEDTTLHDDEIRLLKEEYASEIKSLDAHDQSNLALVGSMQTSGVGDSYSNAQSDLTEERKSGYYIGLQFSTPLGGASSRSEQAMIRARSLGLDAQAESIQKQISATFMTMQKSIILLARGLENQKGNSESLRRSYNDMSRKFEQGRVPVSLVITEQDMLFQSELQEISFRKQIAHAILSYFAVFHDFQCDWNKI